MLAEVVLPFVPVTATSLSSDAGSPYHAAAATATARRVSETMIAGRSVEAASLTIAAAAPAVATCGRNSCPLRVLPCTATKSAPSVTARLSAVIAANCAGSVPRTACSNPARCKASVMIPAFTDAFMVRGAA